MDTRTRRRIVGRTFTLVVLGAALTLISLGFVPQPVRVSIGKVEQRPLEVTVDESGKTRIRNKFVVSAPATGQLSRIMLEAGDTIEERARIAQIAPLVPQLLDTRTRAEAEAHVAVAEANLRRIQSTTARATTALTFTTSQTQRIHKLRSEGGVSQQQLEEAEYQLRAAEEELASALHSEHVAANELAAARAVLTSVRGGKSGTRPVLDVFAPAAGSVLRVLQESESTVQAGAPLVEIGDPKALEIVVDILTTDAIKIAPGATARIERWGGDYPLAGRVRRKEPSAFTTRSALGVEEQRVPVVLDIIDEPARWTELADGYRVEVRVRVAHIDSAVAVPASALFREAGTWAVFAVRGEEARKTQVEVGVRNADWAEIKRGLQPNEPVVLYPNDQVVDGVKVAAQ